MRLGEDFIDEIKARIRLSDIVGRSVQLKRQGREFVGLSPFKKERTPSFYVNDEKRFYHCFASGKHGDAFSWLEEMEGLSFMEAAERLSGEAGLSLPAPDPQAAERTQHRKSLVEWMETAHAFYLRALKSPAAAHAVEYLKGRGLTGQDCVKFGIGYAPDGRTVLKDELVTAGAPIGDLIECGLLIEPDNGSPYDRFRDRIMFPIHDPRGRLVGFGGRALSKEARAKYLNSPETSIFHKGSMLYNFPNARRAASDPKAGVKGLIVAEGYLDVIALDRAGMSQGVAPMGTAITEEQLNLLWRAGGEPVMCLDGDSAGRAAALKAADRALPHLEPGRTLRFAFMPDGKDPDDVLRDEGARALSELLEDTRSLVDLLWEREVDHEPLTDPDRRASFRKRIRALVNQIANGDVKEEYRNEFDRRMEAMFGTPARKGGRGEWQGGRRKINQGASLSLKKRMGSQMDKASMRQAIPNPNGRSLLLALIEYPDLVDELIEEIALISFGALDNLRDAVLDACSLGPAVSSSELQAELLSRGFAQDLKRLEGNRGPMRASIGGADASVSVKVGAWRRLCSVYMRQSGSQEQRNELRALAERKITENDSESVRSISEAYRRENAKDETE
ncbi:DNA primase [Maricaulis sp. MIT060901]|uniref:DNA primase n=1 Tax=Maricaulis sp. MIT060901 TaxID=3096993 RepID=UPI00399AC3CF